MERSSIIEAIMAERARQSELWSHDHGWGTGDCSSHAVQQTTKCAVLTEECGEVCRAVLEKDDTACATELIQVAAVAIAWLESL